MRLTTEKGELDLPKDISITLEKKNPFFNDEGDASLPITLPPTDNNLKILGWMNRTDRYDKYSASVNATLQEGTLSKNGNLIIGSLSKNNGISAVFAYNDAELYSKFKEKKLRDILMSYDEGRGYRKTLLAVELGVMMLQAAYEGYGPLFEDLAVFTVKTSESEDNVFKINQINLANELIWRARTITVGDDDILVPNGYGISPFIRLHRLIDIIFQCMGYTVTENCMSTTYKDIVVVNNCADAIVTATLQYADLVPDFTLAEFIEWMKCRFNIMPVIESATNKVKIVSMESLLTASPATDISDKLCEDITISPQKTKRVVLKVPTEGNTSAAAESFDALIQRYGSYVECDEADFQTLTGSTPAYTDCLILRLITGEFYELRRNVGTNRIQPKRIGTNWFTYDRNNSEETEEYEANEAVPDMYSAATNIVTVAGMNIGSTINRHTAIVGEEDKEDKTQKMMIAWAMTYRSGDYGVTYGTTQKVVQTVSFVLTKPHDLTPHGIYSAFWKRYNEIMLNESPNIDASLITTAADFMMEDIYKPMLYRGRRLIPISATATLNGRNPLKAEHTFKMSANFYGMISDTDIQPSKAPTYKWERDTSTLGTQRDAFIAATFPEYTDSNGDIVQRGVEALHGQEPLDVFPSGAKYLRVNASNWIRLLQGEEYFYLGTPIRLGERRTFQAQAEVSATNKGYSKVNTGWLYHQTATQTFTIDVTVDYVAVAV